MKAVEFRLLVIRRAGPERDTVCFALERAGYSVLCAGSVTEARRVLERFGLPHVVLLSLQAAELDAAVELCREVHALAGVPVIALADDDAGERYVWLLDECAEDLVAWPVSADDVVMRVRRALRRMPDYAYGMRQRVSATGDNGSTEQSSVIDGHNLALSQREAALLQLLQRHPNRVLSNDFLLNQVWGDGPASEGALRVTIHRLRQKIERATDQTDPIVSVRGRGYMYLGPSPANRTGF